MSEKRNIGKNLLAYLFVCFVSLVLVEKSLKPGKIPFFNTTPPSDIPTFSESEIFRKPAPSLFQSDPQNPERISTFSEQVPVSKNKGIYKREYIDVYYLKFYGKGDKTRSYLVRSKRKSRGSLKKDILLALRSLIKGPNEAEQEKGILSTFPGNLKVSRKMSLKNGILYISFNKTFEKGAGPELMKDRLDQLVYTLTSLGVIEGISLHIGNKKLRYLGPHRIQIPAILEKNPRQVIDF
ncbi:MAG: GerMN domain-containing protein [Leptospiraceae bacterium]|nr:GerMN domain-containing protein [Leptospiraceae bacterium]MCP5501105.1 GerMN domain-containing protein [Leptospiraceae bacterium]